MGKYIDESGIHADDTIRYLRLRAEEFDPAPLTIDQLIRNRVSISGDDNNLAYPSSGIDYVNYTARQIDYFAYRCAEQYAKVMPQRRSSEEKPRVVGLLGPSNLDYVVSMLALTKLGHTVLFLSRRISKEALRSLLDQTGAQDLVTDKSFCDVAKDLQSKLQGLENHIIVEESLYCRPVTSGLDTRMDHALDPQAETHYPAWIIHSSGSTSLPKPIYLTHHAALSDYKLNSIPMKGFMAVPLYYSHGISTLCKSFYTGKQVHLYNASLPLANHYLVKVLEAYRFDIFHAVPYTLKLLAEDDYAIELLAQCKIVMYAGSACPDALGDLLTERGVKLVGQYGTTETGQLMTSERSPEDKLWNYLRPGSKSKSFLEFKDRGSGLLELICLPGWPGKVMTNREDGSYATRDLFTKHPEMEAYKYFSRLDDTITLVTGEKANPLLVEGLVRQNTEVMEAVVFGTGRLQLGMLLFPSPNGAELSRKAILDRIWPSLEKAQKEMPKYARLSRSMVKVMPSSARFASTHKETIIRQAIYHQYSSIIDSMYEDEEKKTDGIPLSGEVLQGFIELQIRAILGRDAAIDLDADFFELGMDSVGAVQLRTAILERINLNGQRPGLNIAYGFPSIRTLAVKLEALRADAEETQLSNEEEMANLISEYGLFSREVEHTGYTNKAIKDTKRLCVLVTGATGSLGAHMVSLLSKNPQVTTLYCPVRACSSQHARERILKSMRDRRVLSTLNATQVAKIVALPSDLSGPNLGLREDMYDVIKDNLTTVIHAAWTMNFNLSLSSFKQSCVPQTRYLIELCLASRLRASFNFCSSSSTVSAGSTTALGKHIILEDLPESLSHAEPMGYAQAKLVAEHMALNAAAQTGLTSRVLRIGYICGDTIYGIWNATEALPLMFQSALKIGVLPQLDEEMRWLPVDVAAGTAVELALSEGVPCGVYNVVSSRPFHWTRDLLPLLRDAGLSFAAVPAVEWVAQLRGSDPDPTVNPTYKLVEFFARKYGTLGMAPNAEQWETQKTQAYSKSFYGAYQVDSDLVNKMVRYWTENCWSIGKDNV